MLERVAKVVTSWPVIAGGVAAVGYGAYSAGMFDEHSAASTGAGFDNMASESRTNMRVHNIGTWAAGTAAVSGAMLALSPRLQPGATLMRMPTGKLRTPLTVVGALAGVAAIGALAAGTARLFGGGDRMMKAVEKDLAPKEPQSLSVAETARATHEVLDADGSGAIDAPDAADATYGLTAQGVNLLMDDDSVDLDEFTKYMGTFDTAPKDGDLSDQELIAFATALEGVLNGGATTAASDVPENESIGQGIFEVFNTDGSEFIDIDDGADGNSQAIMGLLAFLDTDKASVDDVIAKVTEYVGELPVGEEPSDGDLDRLFNDIDAEIAKQSDAMTA